MLMSVCSVTCISIVRLYSVIRVWYLRPADGHYTIGYTTNTIEVNLAVVTATIPALWPLARVWFPDVFESMGINRPYLYPDIEVQVRASVGQQITLPALRAKTLWLPRRPHTPSYIRGSASPPTAPGDREGNTRTGDSRTGRDRMRQWWNEMRRTTITALSDGQTQALNRLPSRTTRIS